MIFITRTSATIQLEKYLRPALPDPNSFEGNEFIVEFQYKRQNNMKSVMHDTVFTARFVKQNYYNKNIAKEMCKWVYQGTTR